MKKNNIPTMGNVELDSEFKSRYIDHTYGLFNAIRDKNYEAVKQLVRDHQHNVNCIASGGGYGYAHLQDTPTPLSYAAYRGDENMVQLLIELGAKIDDENAKDEARKGRSAAIQRMLNVHGKNSDLMQYVKVGNHAQVLEELHSTVTGGKAHPGLNNEQDDKTEDTVLHIAVKREDFRMIKILMAAAPFLHIKNKEGKLPKDCTTSVRIQQYLFAAEPPVAAWHNDIKQFQSFIKQKRDFSKKIVVETKAVKCLEVYASSTASFTQEVSKSTKKI